MTIEEIKRNAPDGATHYYNYPVIGYFKIECDFLYIWYSHLENPDWVKYMPVELISGINMKPL